jgi:cell filamentation protein
MSEHEEDPYFDTLHNVLRNKLGINDQARFDTHERRLVTQRIAEGVPTGNYDLAHLQAIHRHLFQDVVEWAGELRKVDMTKNGHRFQFATKLASDINAIHRDLAAKDFLRSLEPGDFAREAALLIGDVNYVHPFREGNGRTQLLYLKQLAEAAGHPLDLTRIPAEPWIEASKASMAGDPEPFAAMILFALS